MPRCAGQKGDGTPCERIVGASQQYCYAHDPSYAQDRKRAASKAARSPAKSRSTTEIREIQIANTQLRAIELERRVREQEELEERLDELEDLLEKAERTAHARW